MTRREVRLRDALGNLFVVFESVVPNPSAHACYREAAAMLKPRQYRTYERHGFVISRTAGPDAPWRGWRPDGVSFRADTLAGAFECARESK